MAYELIHPRPFGVAATFASKQFTFVTLDSSALLASPSAGAYAIGVIQDNPASGAAQVCSQGDFSKIQCGGSFAKGDRLAVGSSGKAVAAVSGDHILGVAMEAGTDTKIATILYQPEGKL